MGAAPVPTSLVPGPCEPAGRANLEAMLRRRIGQRVFLLRSQRRMTALDLAAHADVHRNTIHRIESAICLPGVGQLWRIARALGAGVEDLVRGPYGEGAEG